MVYLPTTFMEDNFVAFSLPVNCLMIVETDGEVQVSSRFCWVPNFLRKRPPLFPMKLLLMPYFVPPPLHTA